MGIAALRNSTTARRRRRRSEETFIWCSAPRRASAQGWPATGAGAPGQVGTIEQIPARSPWCPETKSPAVGRGRSKCGARSYVEAGPKRPLGVLAVEELLVFGRTLERCRRGVALDRRRHGVEVAGADLALVLHCREALLGRRELGFLELNEGAHAVAGIA